MPEVYKDITSFRNNLPETPSNFYFNNDELMTTIMSLNSPYDNSSDSHLTSNMASPISIGNSPGNNDISILLSEGDLMNFDETNAEVIGRPEIIILDQPIEKFRFRYKSEMLGTHGSLPSSSSSFTRKKRPVPTVKLLNFIGEKAIIRCTLTTKNEDRRVPHAHHLVKKEGNDDSDTPYEIEVSEENEWIASYQGMGIIHTAKKNVKDELIKKMRLESMEKLRRNNPGLTSLPIREESRIKMEADQAQKWMDLNSLALCFQAFVPNEHGIMCPITEPVYSNSINNLKSALTGELKICRIDKYSSSCAGNEEVFLLVEKVGKKNIKIKFFEIDEKDNEIWCDYGKFSELDVHHQYAIVFRTPAYKDRNITTQKEVWIQLERPTDGDFSEPMKFIYKPIDAFQPRKRPRMSYCENINFKNSIPSDVTMSSHAFAGSSFCELTSSDVSAEIKKLVVAETNSTELLECIANMDDFSEYLKLAQEDNFQSSLCFDGESSSNSPASLEGPDFAPSVLIEAVQKFKNNSAGINEVFKMLKERTRWGDTPLHSALRYNQRDIVKNLLKIIASSSKFNNLIDMKNGSGMTPLHYAVFQNQHDIVKTLLILGADPNSHDDRGRTVLHEAVKKDETLECLKELLKVQVKIEEQDDLGRNALHLAAENGSLCAVDVLVKAGADVNCVERTCGRTALHLAVESGHTEIVRYLLQKGKVDVNKQNFSGNTALHSAVVNTGTRSLEIIQLLRKYGANPRIANNNKETDDDDDDDDDNEPESVINTERGRNNDLEALGQTSFDLALGQENSNEIISVLGEDVIYEQGDIPSPNVTINPEDSVMIKDEFSEQENMMGWLDVDEMAGLAKILDNNGGWKKLAKKVGCDSLSKNRGSSEASPALTVLSYADIQGCNMRRLFDLLVELEQIEASSFMEGIIRHRTNSPD